MNHERGHPLDIGSKFPESKVEQEQLFAKFQKFVNLDGVDSKTAQEFQVFLKRYFNETGKKWTPGKCVAVLNSRDDASKLAGNCFTKPTHVDSKMFKYYHYWLELKIESAPTLIVDPTGTTDHRNKTFPYFGAIYNAKDEARKIYETGTKA
jgi:hypothetical protein